MLIVALVLAVIGLAALVTAVVTSNEVVAWVCIGASALGVILLVVDAIRERQGRRATATAIAAEPTTEIIDEVVDEETPAEIDTGIESEIDGDATEVVPKEDFMQDFEAELEAEIEIEDHPDEVIHDEPDYDLDSDDEPDYPQAAEEAAIHLVEDPESPVEDLVTEESVSEPEGR